MCSIRASVGGRRTSVMNASRSKSRVPLGTSKPRRIALSRAGERHSAVVDDGDGGSGGHGQKEITADKDDKNGHKLAANTGLPDYRAYATDWTAGLRWDLSSYAMIRAEYHRIDGAGWLPLQDNPDPSQWVKRWNMFSLQLSLRF